MDDHHVSAASVLEMGGIEFACSLLSMPSGIT